MSKNNSTATIKMRRRALIVMIGFVILSFGMIGRMFHLQIVRGEELQEMALRQQTRTLPIEARRGMILDRNGNVLARSADVWNVCISPAEINPDTVNELARDLSEILGVPEQRILDLAAQRQFFYKRVAPRVDADIREQVLNLVQERGYTGVFFEPATRRYYTYGSLASTVLGFTNADNEGAYGLEARYNSVLSGTPGMVVTARNAWGADMPFRYDRRHEARDGNSIVLTLDQGIQHFVERNLEAAIIEHNIRHYATGIVMNVNTGEILAMATVPDFDPNHPFLIGDPRRAAQLEALTPGTDEYREMRRQFQFDQWRNRAITDPYEPGSVFKLLTAAMALENNVVSLDDMFYCSGAIDVATETIHCHHRRGHGSICFVEGMRRSCNPVFISIGQRVGGQEFFNYIHAFGLGERTGIDLPGEAGGILHGQNTLMREGMVELSSSAFGQSNKVTPIQLITAVSATVNGGYLMEPFVVRQIIDPDGNVLETRQPVVRRQVISAETSDEMRLLAEAAVVDGSGRLAAIPGFRIGGKTGTSEKLDADGYDGNILSFVGFVPMDAPRYAILVTLDGPELEDVFGSTIAAPVVGAIMNEMLAYIGMEPQFTQEELEQREVDVPDVLGMTSHDARAILTNRGLQTRMIGTGGEVLRQIPQAWQTVPRGSSVIIYTDINAIAEIIVPDVVGMTAAEANRVIVEAGLNITLRGTVTDGVPTVVREQWPAAGSTITTGEIVTLTLMRRPEQAVPAMELPVLMTSSP